MLCYVDVVEKYIRGLNEKNLEGILLLFAENGSVEDPVGSAVVIGMSGLREFYSRATKVDLELRRTGPVRIAGVEIAFPFQLMMEIDGLNTTTDIIDIFRFNEAGKIVQMRAFWGTENQRRSSTATS